MVKTPQKHEEPKKPVIFLYLAAVMVAVAVLAYAYEDTLYIHRPYTEITFHTVNVYLFGILGLSLIGAFFFLMCYLNPHRGNRLLGRETRVPKKTSGGVSTVTYNVFDDTTTASVKSQTLRRKSARHARRKYAEATRKMEAEKKKKKK